MMIYMCFCIVSIAYVSGGDVVVNNGVVTITGFKNCVLTNNGREFQINNMTQQVYEHENMLFGLIKWKCDKTNTGSLVSFFTCATCGIYCAYNQYLNKCNTQWPSIIIGLICSFMLFMLILILGIVYKNKLWKITINVIMYFIMINDVKRANKIKRFNKITGQNIEVKFKNVKYSNGIIMEEIMKRRLELSGKDADDECQYAAILYNRSIEYKQINAMLERSKERLYTRPAPPPPRNTINKGILVGTAILAASAPLQTVYSCDQMLYLKSNGRVCYSDKCYDLSTYSLMLSDGETACFNDINNERLSIKLNKIQHVTKFSKIYETASYNMSVESTWNCYGSGKCWYGSECGKGYMLNLLKKETKEPHGYGCHMTSVSCNGMCTHGVSCVWFRWQVNPNLSKKYNVYQVVSEMWKSTVTFEYKGVKKVVNFNSNNPKYDLNDIFSGIMSHMPIYVNNVMYEKPYIRSGLLVKDGRYYNMEVSPHNEPMNNMIGDIQIDKEGKTIFYSSDMDCSTDSCVVKCMTNGPSVDRVPLRSPYLIDTDNVALSKVYNNDWALYKNQVAGHITIYFGNIELKELIVEKPHCELEIVLSYACEYCLEQPRAILTSKNLVKEGALDFDSNCTWNRQTLSCNTELYEIIQETKERYCRITIPLLNKTLDINFEYEYRGQLTDMKSLKAESFTDILSSVGTDSTFYKTLFSSLTSFLLITTISTVLIKLSKIGVLCVGKKEVQKA